MSSFPLLSITEIPLMTTLSFLDVHEIGRLRLVCKELRDLIDRSEQNLIWKARCLHEGLRSMTDIEMKVQTYRTYLERNWTFCKLGHSVIPVNPQFISLMIRACKSGHVVLICKQLDRTDLSQVTISRILQEAAGSGHTNAVDKILTQHDRMLDDRDLGRAFVKAVSKGHRTVVKQLMTHEQLKAAFSSKALDLALFLAAGWGHVDLFILLMNNYGARMTPDRKAEAVRFAFTMGRKIILDLVRENVPELLSGIDELDDSTTVRNLDVYAFLMECASEGIIDCVEMIINHEEFIQDVSPQRLCQVLRDPIINGHSEVVELFLENKAVAAKLLEASVYRECLSRLIALAIQNNQNEVVLTFLRNKEFVALMPSKDFDMFIRLSIKSSRMEGRNCNELILELIKHVDPYKLPSYLYTLLDEAANQGNLELAKQIVTQKQLAQHLKKSDLVDLLENIPAAHKNAFEQLFKSPSILVPA